MLFNMPFLYKKDNGLGQLERLILLMFFRYLVY